MGDMDNTVSVITGASGGLGRKLYELFSQRGSFPIGAARSVDVLADLQRRFGGDFVEYDATSEGSNQRLLDVTFDAVRQQGADHLYFVYAAGQHEKPEILDDGTYTTPEILRELKGKEYLDFLADLNERAPKQLVQGLAESNVPSTFLYISSQAAKEDPWWKMGNSVYGPQKRAVEKALYDVSSPNLEVLATRYPFFDTDMAHGMYDRLVAGGEDLPPKDELFAPVDSVAQATVDLLASGASERFKALDSVVYSYQK